MAQADTTLHQPTGSEIPVADAAAATPEPVATPAVTNVSADAAAILSANEEFHKSVRVNLLSEHEEEVPEVAPPVTPVAAAAVPVVAGSPVLSRPIRHRHTRVIIAAVIALLAVGGGAFALTGNHSTPTATPTPKAVAAVPVVTPSPSVTPTDTPTPTPTPTPLLQAPTTVSLPVVAPTVSAPQTVTVKSKNGLWLRSSATSVNNKNIIGLIPNGAQVSVDSTGSFWWHGTYNGKSGFFASTYTQ